MPLFDTPRTVEDEMPRARVTTPFSFLTVGSLCDSHCRSAEGGTLDATCPGREKKNRHKHRAQRPEETRPALR